MGLRCWRAAALVILAVCLAGCGLFGSSTPKQTPGTIVFGSGAHRVSAYQWTIRNEGSTFRDGHFVGWVAQLQKPLGKAPVTVSVTNVRTGTVIFQHLLSEPNPRWVQLADNVPVDSFVKAGPGSSVPGTYRLEYVQEGTVLARGTFKITAAKRRK